MRQDIGYIHWYSSTYNTVKLAPLVALGLASVIFRLASAELAEIFSGSWDHIPEQLHLDAAQSLTCCPC